MKKTVAVYSTPTCHFCHLAKDYLTSKGVAFESFDVSQDREKMMEIREKTGQMGVPVIFIRDSETGTEDIVLGFDKPLLNQILSLS